MSSLTDILFSAWPVALIASLGYYLFRSPTLIPGIPYDPVYRRLSGHAREVMAADKSGRGASDYLQEYASKWGSVCQILLGKRAVVLISDPKEVELVLRRNSSSFCRSDRFRVSFAWTLPYGQISMDEGPMWRTHRKLMGPSMLPPFLGRMAPRINQHVSELVELWEAKCEASRRMFETGAAFEADPDIHLLMMDSISDITFGKSLAGLQSSLSLLRREPLPQEDGDRRVKFSTPPNKHYETGRRLVAMMDSAITSGFPKIAYLLQGYLSSSWHTARTFFRAVLTNTLSAYRQRLDDRRGVGSKPEEDHPLDGDNEPESVLSLLFDKPEGRERVLAENMPEHELLDELALFFFAGQDTTAAALLWSLKLLTLNPRVQHTLRKELVTAHDLPPSSPSSPQSPTLSYEQLQSKSTPYLDAVVSECLRLAHVVGVLSRQAKHDTIIGGHPVPKGTELFLLFNAVNVNGFGEAGLKKTDQSDPPASDGAVFRPERWLNAEGEFDGNAWPLYAFSAGARRCFGQKLAMLSLKLALSALNLAFFFDRLPSSELEGWEVKEGVVREPLKSWVMPRKWDDE